MSLSWRNNSWAWAHVIVLELERVRQKDCCEFEASLCYIVNSGPNWSVGLEGLIYPSCRIGRGWYNEVAMHILRKSGVLARCPVVYVDSFDICWKAAHWVCSNHLSIFLPILAHSQWIADRSNGLDRHAGFYLFIFKISLFSMYEYFAYMYVMCTTCMPGTYRS